MSMISLETRLRPSAPTSSLLRSIDRAIQLRKQRKTLKSLDDARLDDLGLSPADAQREAKRPVWDVPSHWRR